MNTFGRLFRVSILGESHGLCVGILIDGCPCGIEISTEYLIKDLKRRQGGKGKGTTSRKEPDLPLIKSGIFNNKTTGSPILILFENTNVKSKDYERIRYTPRPGHADFTAWKKYKGFNDYRGGGHFSGRVTTGLVAAGAIAKQIIKPINISAKILQIGGLSDTEKALNETIKKNDSIGGIIECKAKNIPPGLGEPFFDSVESLISHGIFAIPGVKGIEFGIGFSVGKMKGSQYNDEIIDIKGTTKTNRCGGINGGITNSNDIIFRVAVRPTPSISLEQKTIDIRSGKSTQISTKGRHDACITLRIPVIVEAITAITLLDLMMLNKAIY